MLRYLRIAVTALSLTACVLLIALWVRSYWRIDSLSVLYSPSRLFVAQSVFGKGTVSIVRRNTSDTSWFHSYALTEASVDPLKDSFLGFHYARQASFISGTFPYWCPILLTIAMAASLYRPLPRCFSLRTLLIATTLVAVVLGLIVLL